MKFRVYRYFTAYGAMILEANNPEDAAQEELDRMEEDSEEEDSP